MDRMERVAVGEDASVSERNPRVTQDRSRAPCSTFIQCVEDVRWNAGTRAVLSLQRHAGNRAVAGLVQRRQGPSVPVQQCGDGTDCCCGESHDDPQEHREPFESVQRAPVNEPCPEAERQTSPVVASSVRRHNGPVIQRYGHARSCSDSVDLKPCIWPGHFHARRAIDNAIRLLNQEPLDNRTTDHVRHFFGKNSLEKPNLAKIRGRFQRVGQALDQHYLYHCGQVGGEHSEDKKAFPCKGQNARTDESSLDITLCFDRLGANDPVIWTAWLIIHENVHRTGLFGVHVWYPDGGVAGCFAGPALSSSAFVDDNPDSYACFAIVSGSV